MTGAITKAREAIHNSSVILSNLKNSDPDGVNEWEFHLDLNIKALHGLDALIDEVKSYDLEEILDSLLSGEEYGIKSFAKVLKTAKLIQEATTGE